MALLFAGACVGDPEGPPDRAVVAVDVAALSLEGVADVVWDVRVVTSTGDEVFARRITSSRFGDGRGSASLVGPCDAAAPDFGDGPPGHNNAAEIRVIGLYSAPVATPGEHGEIAPAPGLDFLDPGPLTRSFSCLDNADTLVAFEVALLRPARQGFLDVAVSFDDLFCSAKLDCTHDEAGDSPIRLLHHPDTGARSPTVVVALSCMTGVAGATPRLLRDGVEILCGEGDAQTRIVLDPGFGHGNAYPHLPPPAAGPVWQYAVYAGADTMPCGAGSCDVVHWNLAVGFDAGLPDCRLVSSASAIDPLRHGGQIGTPPGTSWPIIDYDVALTNASGELTCTRHPLHGTPGGVTTRYTDLEHGHDFAAAFDGETFQSSAPSSWEFTGEEPGYEVFTAPTAGTYELRAWGAQGGGPLGGLGGYAVGHIALDAQEELYVFVGGVPEAFGKFGGSNGGGLGSAGGWGGGGGSDVRRGGVALPNRVLVAGGGGGSGRNTTADCTWYTLTGGFGGGLIGGAGANANINAMGGGGGTQSAGGAKGSGYVLGGDGSFGQGGRGAHIWSGDTEFWAPSGGGGGGWYGGGGGAYRGNVCGQTRGGGAGGGGSSYVGGVVDGSTAAAVHEGPGHVEIVRID